VEKIKAIHNLMTENMEKHYTQEEFSEQFDIPLTPMKLEYYLYVYIIHSASGRWDCNRFYGGLYQ